MVFSMCASTHSNVAGSSRHEHVDQLPPRLVPGWQFCVALGFHRPIIADDRAQLAKLVGEFLRGGFHFSPLSVSLSRGVTRGWEVLAAGRRTPAEQLADGCH